MNVVPFSVPPRKRAANKLALWFGTPRFTALIDALLDIRPRRTEPEGCEVLILEDHVFLALGESDGDFMGMLHELNTNLTKLAEVAELDDEERAAVFEAVEQARIDMEGL